LISNLKFATSKRKKLQKIRFKLGQLSFLKVFTLLLTLALTPLSPHLPLFNLAIVGIELSFPWGKGKELTTKPFLFQMI
jgi:hypothetical protein